MDINEQNIEQIVQNVLAKLRDGDTAAPAAKPGGEYVARGNADGAGAL